jgi:hypothetical protein
MMFTEEKVKPTPVADTVVQANKKRRASFIPTASSKSRKSIDGVDTKVSVIAVVPTSQSNVVIPDTVQGNEVKKNSGKSRLSMSKEAKTIPTGGQENENPQIQNKSAPTKGGATGRRKSLSNVQSVLDNIQVAASAVDSKQSSTLAGVFNGLVKRVTRRSQQVLAGSNENIPVVATNDTQYWGDI